MRRRPRQIVIDLDETERAAVPAALDDGVLDGPGRLEELAGLRDEAGDEAARILDLGFEHVRRIMRRIIVDAAPLAGKVDVSVAAHLSRRRPSSTSSTGTPSRTG